MFHRLRRLPVLLTVLVAFGCNCQPASTGPQPASANTQTEGELPEVPHLAEGEAADPEAALPEDVDADPRERFIANLVASLLQSEHLAARKIDDDVAQKAFDFYVERLDPAKLFLLQSEVDAMQKSALSIDDQLRSGDLKLAHQAGALMAARRKEIAAMIAELTAKPFDLTVDESLETDGEKRAFATSKDELRDLWRKNLKLQVLERMVEMRAVSAARAKRDEEAKKAKPGEAAEATPPKNEEPLPSTDAEREKKAREEIAQAYAGRFKRLEDSAPLDAAEKFVNAIAAVFDPHTMYLAPDDKANFDIQMTGALEGIGAVLSEGDHYIEVREVVPGGAAWRQGDLEAGDLIMSVAQEDSNPVDVGDMRLNEVVKMIRGPKGTLVTLSVRKADGQLASIAISRDVVVVEATYARGAVLEVDKKHPKVGYVYLPGFYGNTRSFGSESDRNATDDVRALLEQFNKRKIRHVILDLRGNGGGLLNHATAISGLFIDEGPVVQVRAPSGDTQVLSDEEAGIVYGGKLIVMVDRFSASASEILAGALQDYGRALIVGTGPTHGKGTVQMLFDFDRVLSNRNGPSLGVLKLTIQQFFLVDGDSTQQRGVQPDIVLPDPMAFLESGERYLDNPVPFSAVEPLAHTPWEDAPKLDALRKQSDKRRASNDAFARVLARSEFLKARRDDTRLPLKASAFNQRQDDEKKALEALDPEIDEQPGRFSVKLVEYRPDENAGDDPRLEEARKAAQERVDEWREKLARDPWLAEALELADAM